MQQHLRKAGIIPDRGIQSAAAAFEIRLLLRIPPLFPLQTVIDMVQGGDPAELFLRDKEAGILHFQRIEDIFLQVFAQGFAGQHLGHGSQHVDGETVHPSFTGFKSQRELTDQIGVFHSAREGLAGFFPLLSFSARIRPAAVSFQP